MALDADLLADDVWRAGEAALPESVAQDSDLGGCATGRIGIGGNEEAAEKRCCAKLGIDIAGDAGEVFARKDSVGFHVPHAPAAPTHETGKDALVALDLAEHGIRKRDFAVGAAGGKLDETLGIANR